MEDVSHGILEGHLQSVLVVLKQAEDNAPDESSKQREDCKLGLWYKLFLDSCVDKAKNYSRHDVEIHLNKREKN